jgi:hypothetical protein
MPQTSTLTPQQRLHFDIFGYVHIPQLFRSEEVESCGAAMEAVLEKRRGGSAFAGERSERITPLGRRCLPAPIRL